MKKIDGYCDYLECTDEKIKKEVILFELGQDWEVCFCKECLQKALNLIIGKNEKDQIHSQIKLESTHKLELILNNIVGDPKCLCHYFALAEINEGFVGVMVNKHKPEGLYTFFNRKELEDVHKQLHFLLEK